MGTHPKSPSRLLTTDATLSSYLASHPDLIGKSVLEKFKDEGMQQGNLPFLFKLLSIEKALSIQTHPDKKTAEALHKSLPGIYKGIPKGILIRRLFSLKSSDPNHKPEMALAITSFQALCGFRPLPEIASYLNNTPELKALIPPSILTTFLSLADSNPEGQEEKSSLKNVFASLMTAPDEEVKKQLDALLKRYASDIIQEDDKEVANLVVRLSSQFPGDVGIFCAFMLNYVKLEPSQAIFLGAGEPHAYVSGGMHLP